MELHQVEVKTLKSKTLPWMEEAVIVPLGDIQFGTEACDVDRLKRHVEWGSKQPNAYYLGMGDYGDFASPSNRGLLRSLTEQGKLYDTAEDILDEGAQEHTEELAEILAPTKGKWLGMLEGHHYWTFGDGSTSDTRLCKLLDAPFLGTCAIVRVVFDAPKHKERPHLHIWAHHGVGSGQLQSAPLNKLERLANAWEDVDVFLMGHQHKKSTAIIQRLRPRFGLPGGAQKNNRLDHRCVYLAGTGSFLRGYHVGSKRGGRPKGGYVEAKMMTPVALGGVVLYVRPRNSNGYTSVDINIST